MGVQTERPAEDAAEVAAQAPSDKRGAEAPLEQVVLPVMAERLRVSKRLQDTGGVRVTTQVRERAEEIEVPLLREEIDVQRLPVGRYIDEPAQTRFEGDTMIVPVMEEVLVVEKRLLLKEELHVRRSSIVVPHRERHVLRAEELTVEALPPEAAPAQDGGAPRADRSAK